MVSCVPLKYAGCSLVTGKVVGIQSSYLMVFYQLRIDPCCALISNYLARKFIVNMMLLILCFIKEYKLFACFWGSCLPGSMVVTCSVVLFVRTLVALKLIVNSFPLYVNG